MNRDQHKGRDIMIRDYEKQVYTAILGKIIGVYLGRPFEGWRKKQIQETWGEIDHYVHDERQHNLIATDDDITGTFTFVKILSDSGLWEKTPVELFGENWLNYVIEDKSIFWWGGACNSTEHTAFLRLKNGIPAPRSGSIAMNGKAVAEQIGGQIFIDAFGMVAPGNPKLAAELARKAASVSHDGECIYAAQVVAVMVSMAFQEKNIDTLLDRAMDFIPSQSIIAQVHRDVRKWARENPDWNRTYDLIMEKYGQLKYPGGCHVVTNHALMVMAWAYGQGDFFKTLSIINTAGADTDCNSGNVGSVTALAAGLEHLNDIYDFRGPVADRFILPTADGTDSVTDALRCAYRIAAIGKRIMKMPEQIKPKNGAHFHFEMPGAVHGFVPREREGVTCRGYASATNPDGHALEFRFTTGRGITSAVQTALAGCGKHLYQTITTPLLYSGNTVRIKGNLQAPGDTGLRLYVDLHQTKSMLPADSLIKPRAARVFSPRIIPDADGSFDFTWKMEFQGFAEFFGIEAVSDRLCSGIALIDSIDFGGTADFELPVFEDDFGRIITMKSIGRTGHQEFENMPDTEFYTSNGPGGIMAVGSRYWGNVTVSAQLGFTSSDRAGLLIRYQGLRRWIGVFFTRDGKLQIIRNHYGETVLAECSHLWTPCTYDEVEITAVKERIMVRIGGRLILEASDDTYDRGGVAVYSDFGRIGCNHLKIKADWDPDF